MIKPLTPDERIGILEAELEIADKIVEDQQAELLAMQKEYNQWRNDIAEITKTEIAKALETEDLTVTVFPTPCLECEEPSYCVTPSPRCAMHNYWQATIQAQAQLVKAKAELIPLHALREAVDRFICWESDNFGELHWDFRPHSTNGITAQAEEVLNKLATCSKEIT